MNSCNKKDEICSRTEVKLHDDCIYMISRAIHGRYLDEIL